MQTCLPLNENIMLIVFYTISGNTMIKARPHLSTFSARALFFIPFQQYDNCAREFRTNE